MQMKENSQISFDISTVKAIPPADDISRHGY
jgi:hypothetical protein